MSDPLTPDDLERMRVWLEGVADELRMNPNDAFTPDAMAALSADAVRLLDEVERLRNRLGPVELYVAEYLQQRAKEGE